jgi:hypothetical protein
MASNTTHRKVTGDVFAKELDKFCDQIVSKPELFAGESKDVSSKVLTITKMMFDHGSFTASTSISWFRC